MSQQWLGLALVAGVFGAATLGTILAVVSVAHLGLAQGRLRPLERYVHVVAGLSIAAGGAAVRFQGI